MVAKAISRLSNRSENVVARDHISPSHLQLLPTTAETGRGSCLLAKSKPETTQY
jgi:hypothetical protein